ncbi:NUDIX domain-containing protein [Nafulsella turpanensis]|uniref:NUDIX domain-containing protein n=1 Tax=Nafulsella turpanensis TaxID=1265690 RepID=UPI0005908FC5|nr:NUDIX hydrolase [Nafulsella turpanensis]
MSDRDFIHQKYGNRLRLRVCGICIENGHILLVRHKGLGEEGELWLPPGGEAEWDSSLPDNLKREFKEETGLEISVKDFLFVHEHLQAPLHAVELFFSVQRKGGHLHRGTDPELSSQEQIIQEVRFMNFDELNRMGMKKLHALFHGCSSMEELNNKAGYFKFEK